MVVSDEAQINARGEEQKLCGRFYGKVASVTQKVKGKMRGVCEKEIKNHRIINIMFVVLFSLVILLTLVGGVRVDMGSVIRDDGNSVRVRQNYFQLVSAAVSGISMSREQAMSYALRVNNEIPERFGVLGLNIEWLGEGVGAVPPFEELDNFGALIEEIRERGHNPNSINWIRFRYAFARAILDHDFDEARSAFGGHMAVTLAGQAILRTAFSTLMLVISLVMLVFSILALVKKDKSTRAPRPFGKVRLSFVYLLIGVFGNMIFRFAFLQNDWVWTLIPILIFSAIGFYTFMRHMMMENRDFSPSMFVHNTLLLLGGIVSFVFLTGPLFRVNNPEGFSVWYGINYIFDLAMMQTAYVSLNPMSYVISVVVIMVLFGLPLAVNVFFIIKNLDKIYLADYRHNEKKVSLVALLILSFAVFLAFAIAPLAISDLYLTVTPLWTMFILQLVVVGGLVAFEYLFKVKPVRKELVIR